MTTYLRRMVTVPASAQGGDRVIRRHVREKKNEPFPVMTFMGRQVPVKKLQNFIDKDHPEMWTPIDLWWYRLIDIMRGEAKPVDFNTVEPIVH